MDALIMDSKISMNTDTHRLIFNLSDKINLKMNDKYVVLSNLTFSPKWKNMKK